MKVITKKWSKTMGMFDIVEIRKPVVVGGWPPILPYSYQTKSLDCKLQSFSGMEELLQHLKSLNDNSLSNGYRSNLRIYGQFFSDDLENILRKYSSPEILFYLDGFEQAVKQGWIEYHLEINSDKLIRVDLCSKF